MTPTMASLGLDKLSRDERLALLNELRESVQAEPSPISDEFREELRRRAEDADLHPEDGVPWEEVWAKVQARFKQ